MPKAKAKTEKKPDCEVKTMLGCNNQCVRRMTGTKKTDPVFWCCIGCAAILKRQGVRIKEVA